MNKVVSNSVWIMAENVLQMAISVIVGIISARFLGPSNYGLINYGATLVSIFGVIAKLGLDSIIVKEFVDKPDDAGELIGTTLVLKTLASLLSLGAIWLFLSVLGVHKDLLITVTLLQSLSICFQGIDVISQWYQSKLKSKYTSIARSIAHVGIALYKIALLVFRKDVRWFAFATTLEYIIIVFALLLIYIRTHGPRWSVSQKTAKQLLFTGFPFIWSGLVVTAYMQLDKLMLGYFCGETEVGLYSAAIAISSSFGFIFSAIINSMSPVITKEHQINEKSYQQKLILLFSVILWIGIIISFGITLFSNVIMGLLYGKAYIRASTVLSILSWGTVLSYLGAAREVFLINEKLNIFSIIFVSMGGVLNIVLNYFFIQLWSIEGAAIATLLTYFAVVVINPLFFSSTRRLVKYYVKALSPQYVIQLLYKSMLKKT